MRERDKEKGTPQNPHSATPAQAQSASMHAPDVNLGPLHHLHPPPPGPLQQFLRGTSRKGQELGWSANKRILRSVPACCSSSSRDSHTFCAWLHVAEGTAEEEGLAWPQSTGRRGSSRPAEHTAPDSPRAVRTRCSLVTVQVQETLMSRLKEPYLYHFITVHLYSIQTVFADANMLRLSSQRGC